MELSCHIRFFVFVVVINPKCRYFGIINITIFILSIIFKFHEILTGQIFWIDNRLRQNCRTVVTASVQSDEALFHLLTFAVIAYCFDVVLDRTVKLGYFI